MPISGFPLRQIHLDFHTSPDIPDVGADWDADHFTRTLTDAGVGSITVFATCHHGMCYYPSKVAPQHPSLSFDLLGEQIEACHRAGIRAPIYLTVAWNVSAAQRHPEWRQVDKNGKFVGAGPLDAGWPWLCVGTEYAEELMAQTEELLANYDCDGFFYDILMYHPDGCLNEPSLRSMRKLGLDPENALDRRNHNHLMARRFMERTSRLIKDKRPDAGIFYNSRWGVHFQDESEYYSQVEIESLPTGGWGYGFYPLWSRYGRTFDKPMLGMTGRFHRTWADWGGLKHPDALKFESGGILATGGAVSIGDQLHPRGKLNQAVYDVIGSAFNEIKSIERYCENVMPVVEAALLILDPSADKAKQSAGGIVTSASENLEGAAKALIEQGIQFNVVTEKTCSDFDQYRLLVIPDRAAASTETIARLKTFVANGGALLISHEALVEDDTFLLADEIGADRLGPATSNPDYFTLTDPALHGVVTRPGFAYCLYDGPTTRVQPRPGTKILADAHETYFNRTWEHFISHGFTPPTDAPSTYPAILQNGNVIYLYGPFFTAYQRYGALALRDVIGKCTELLLGKERLLTTSAPKSAETTLMQQSTESGSTRHIVHIVNYSPQRRAPGHVEVLDTPVPLHEVSVTVRRAEATTKVFLARSGEPLPFHFEEGTVTFTVPRVAAHEMIILE